MSNEELIHLRNQPSTKAVRVVELIAVEELRGDGKDQDAPFRRSVTLWRKDGVKVADLDEETLESLLDLHPEETDPMGLRRYGMGPGFGL